MGYELSTEFIHKPHEWDPRRLYSQTGADWQYRVDFDRMRAERLQRTREQMEAYDLGALVLFAGAIADLIGVGYILLLVAIGAFGFGYYVFNKNDQF